MSVEPEGMYVVKKNNQYLSYGNIDFNIMWGVDYDVTYTTTPMLVMAFEDKTQAKAIAFLVDGKAMLWGDDK